MASIVCVLPAMVVNFTPLLTSLQITCQIGDLLLGAAVPSLGDVMECVHVVSISGIFTGISTYKWDFICPAYYRDLVVYTSYYWDLGSSPTYFTQVPLIRHVLILHKIYGNVHRTNISEVSFTDFHVVVRVLGV